MSEYRDALGNVIPPEALDYYDGPYGKPSGRVRKDFADKAFEEIFGRKRAKPDPAKSDPAKPDPAEPDPAEPDPAEPDLAETTDGA